MCQVDLQEADKCRKKPPLMIIFRARGVHCSVTRPHLFGAMGLTLCLGLYILVTFGYTSIIYPAYVGLKRMTSRTEAATRPYFTPQDGTLLLNNTSRRTCNDFFTVFPVGTLDEEESSKESCKGLFESYHENFKVINARMEAMESTFYVYSDYADTETVCDLKDLPHIQSVRFHPRQLLEKYNLGGTIYETIQNDWSKKYARISDVFRILLARQYGHSYLDTDVVFLKDQPDYFSQPYVGVSVFRDNLNALEITNAAFCLPDPILDRMILFLKNRIRHGPSRYFYTELGPSLFHKVVFNANPPVSLYSVNNPSSGNMKRLAEEAVAYNHLLLHLTGHVRKANPTLKYGALVNTIELQIKTERERALHLDLAADDEEHLLM